MGRRCSATRHVRRVPDVVGRRRPTAVYYLDGARGCTLDPCGACWVRAAPAASCGLRRWRGARAALSFSAAPARLSCRRRWRGVPASPPCRAVLSGRRWRQPARPRGAARGTCRLPGLPPPCLLNEGGAGQSLWKPSLAGRVGCQVASGGAGQFSLTPRSARCAGSARSVLCLLVWGGDGF